MGPEIWYTTIHVTFNKIQEFEHVRDLDLKFL